MRKQLKKRFKQLSKIIVFLGIITLIMIIYANWKIPNEARKYIYTDIDSIPEHNVALILGTSRYLGSKPNIYFTNRINAAKQLYLAGKVDAFVVSGDNKHVSYNEPRDMRRALVEIGVPDSIINYDFAGFRTLDSVIRMNKVFGQKSFIIVSQQFHNERAIYIARYYGIEAFGYNAEDLALNRASYRTKIREVFARVKVFIDIALGIEPKFLGERVDISTSTQKDSIHLPDSSTNDIDSLAIDSIQKKPE